MNFCRPCLGLEEGALWDISFSCPACMIESEKWQEAKSAEMEEELAHAEEALRSLGASLKPGMVALPSARGRVSEMVSGSRRNVFPRHLAT